MEGRNNLFWKVLFSLLIMAVYGSCSAAYAAEFGGFEVSTGTGEYEGTGEEWEDEPVCNTPEQNDSNTYVDEARNDGQESEQNTSGTVSYTHLDVYKRQAVIRADSTDNMSSAGNAAADIMNQGILSLIHIFR